MNSRVILLHILFACIVLWLSIGLAQAGEPYVFDTAHTAIHFSVNSFGFSELTAEFTKYDGCFLLSKKHPEKDKIFVILYSEGIRTADEDQEEELRGPDFFNAGEFPEVRFISTEVKFVDKNDAEVEGNLTLLGVTKPIVLHVHFPENDPDSSDDGYVTNFSAFGRIERSDFGMDHLIPIIGDEVRLHIEAKGVAPSR